MKWLAAGAAGLMGMSIIGGMGAALGQAPPTATVGFTPSLSAVGDIPADILPIYVAAGDRYGLDWAILAGIGKVETDHCRSNLPGVHSGSNFAGAQGCMQFLPGTWAIYGAGGNPYDPADAIPAAARLLRASGAPADYHSAIFAYNHLESYVADVMSWAQKYRDHQPLALPQVAGPPSPGSWLAPVPGTGLTCDARIVDAVVTILTRYRARLTACYAPTGHEAGGEHPLGLATDIVPDAGGSWPLLGRLAHDLGWREACAATGCAEQLPRPFRFIGWNGYPGHGDPAHAGTNAHIHLSWAHGPGLPAATVG